MNYVAYRGGHLAVDLIVMAIYHGVLMQLTSMFKRANFIKAQSRRLKIIKRCK